MWGGAFQDAAVVGWTIQNVLCALFCFLSTGSARPTPSGLPFRGASGTVPSATTRRGVPAASPGVQGPSVPKSLVSSSRTEWAVHRGPRLHWVGCCDLSCWVLESRGPPGGSRGALGPTPVLGTGMPATPLAVPRSGPAQQKSALFVLELAASSSHISPFMPVKFLLILQDPVHILPMLQHLKFPQRGC